MPRADFKDLTDKEVKKRLKAGLTARWWRQAWPGQSACRHDKAMVNGIKLYQEAKRGTSVAELRVKLLGLKITIDRVRHDAKLVLSKADLPNRRKAILSDLDTVDRLADEELKAAGKFGSKTREVYRYDLAAKVMDALKSDPDGKHVTMRGKMVKIELLEVIVQEIDAKNLLNSLFAEYSNATDDEVKAAADKIRVLAKARVGSNEDETVKRAQKILDEHAKTLAELHHRAPTRVIKKLGLNAAMEAEYQKELKSRRIAIAKSTVMTAASGVAITLPGTQALAIYGCARSAAGWAQQVREYGIKIDTAAKGLQTQLSYLAKAFDKAAKRAASETGGTTLNAVLGIDLVPTLDKATSNYKDLKLNTSHAGFKTQKMIDEIMVAMDSCDASTKAAEALPESHKKKKKMEKQAKKARGGFDKMLKLTTKMGRPLNEVERKLPRLGRALHALGKNSASQDFANYTVKVLVNLTAIAGGGLVDATNAVENAAATVTAAEKVAAIAIAGTGYADELHSTAKDVVAMSKK